MDWIRTLGSRSIGFVHEIKPTRQVVLDAMNEVYDVLDTMQLREPATP